MTVLDTPPTLNLTDDRPSADDVMQSLTGFDEIAIGRAFGRTLADMRADPFQMMRALLFIEARRDGLDDNAAHHWAMTLPLGTVGDAYPTHPSEDLDDDKQGAAGE